MTFAEENCMSHPFCRGSKERCSEKFLCSITGDWARGGGGILAPILTSLSSLSSLTDYDTLIAARSGFLGWVL